MVLPQLGTLSFEIIAVACLTAFACILPGVFLVLRKGAFQSDAVAHSVLLGVVVHYIAFSQTDGVLVYAFAVFSGFACLLSTQTIVANKWLSSEAALAFSFSTFFAGSLVLIALYASTVHLDTDSVMLGELVFVVFDRVQIGRYDMGPTALYRGLAVFCFNLAFVTYFYKILQLRTFDEAYTRMLTATVAQKGTKQSQGKWGKVDFLRQSILNVNFLDTALVFLTAISAVLALEVVGVVLAVSFFVVPAATAFLFIQRRLWQIFPLAFLLATLGIVAGYYFSAAIDASVAGGMAVFLGIIFVAVSLFGFAIRSWRGSWRTSKRKAVEKKTAL